MNISKILTKINVRAISKNPSKNLYDAYERLFLYLITSSKDVPTKSTGLDIQKYIIKNSITDFKELYSKPRNDKNPIPINVNIINAIVIKNRIKIVNAIISRT